MTSPSAFPARRTVNPIPGAKPEYFEIAGDDLVDADGGVKLFLPSKDFTLPSVPRSLADYVAFCERTKEFVMARNQRIHQLAA